MFLREVGSLINRLIELSYVTVGKQEQVLGYWNRDIVVNLFVIICSSKKFACNGRFQKSGKSNISIEV